MPHHKSAASCGEYLPKGIQIFVPIRSHYCPEFSESFIEVPAAEGFSGDFGWCRFEVSGGPEQYRLRFGLDRHRFVPVIVPMGAFQVDEVRREDPHVA